MLCPKKEGYDGRKRMLLAATSPYPNVRYAGCLDPKYPLGSTLPQVTFVASP